MNRKGTILLILVAFGFLGVVLLFYTLDISGSKSSSIGKLQLDAIGKMAEGEKILFFIDKSAEYSIHEALYDLGKKHAGVRCQWGGYTIWKFEGECNPTRNVRNKFKEYFNLRFNSYLSVLKEVYSVDIRYTVDDIGLEGGKVLGKSNSVIELGDKDVIYKIRPRFSVDMNYDLNIYEEILKKIEKSADCLVTEEKDLNKCIPGWKIEKGNNIFVFEIVSEKKYPIFEDKLELRPITINFAMIVDDIKSKASETEGLV